MSTLLIGARGSMGKRYQAILKHLDEAVWCVDKEHSIDEILKRARRAERVILATPTESHWDFLQRLLPLGKPILCEKPIVKDSEKLIELYRLSQKHRTPLTMMLQYSELLKEGSEGESYYDYFRTGNDGLIWDCLQIIGLSDGEVDIRNDSPIWTCKINGQVLNLSEMDGAYVSFVSKWLNNKIEQDFAEIIAIHEKVEQLENERNFQLN